MILIFLKIFVEGFLGNLVFSEPVLEMEIQFCFKVGSSSLIVIKSAVESLLSYSSFHSPAPHLSILQLSFQPQHQWYICRPCSPPVFLLDWSTLQRLPWPLFSLWLGLCHARAREGAMSLLSDKWSPEPLQWVQSRSLRQCLAKGSKVEKEGDGSAPMVSFFVSGLAFFYPIL